MEIESCWLLVTVFGKQTQRLCDGPEIPAQWNLKVSLTDRLTGVGSRDAWALPITMTMTMLPRRCPNIEMQICQRALSLPARAALVDKCFTHQHHHHHHHHHHPHHHYHQYGDDDDDYGGVGDNNDYDDGSDFFDGGGVVGARLW